MTKSFPRMPATGKTAPRGFAPRLRAALLRRPRRAAFAGAGTAGMRRAEGLEFAEVRAYAEGDDPRRIDWAASARAGSLQTRVYLEETPLVFAVLVDATASMCVGREESHHDAGERAAALWYAAAQDDDRCARVWSTRLIKIGRGAGRASAAVCEHARENEGATSLAAGFAVALATLPRGTRLLVVTDGFEDIDDAVARAARRFDVTMLLPADPWAHDALPRGFIKARDAETGRIRTLYLGNQQRTRIRAAMRTRERTTLERWKELGARAGVLDPADVATSLLAAVMHA
jgi:uncharacterized protein (DUF58 family)